MWITSKIRQAIAALRPGVVTLKYPFAPRPAPKDFRGQPVWDHHKCVGCGGCAAHCPARTILLRDLCQDIRIMLYDGSRCTYCGRCADLCPEKAITMSGEYELATDQKEDITQTLELFMLTCQRCGRCFNHEITNVIDKMDVKGYRHDNLETRVVIRSASEHFDAALLKKSEDYQRPQKMGE